MEAAWGKAKRPRNPQRGPAPLFLLIIALALIGHGCAVVKSGNPSSSVTVSNPSVSNITSTGASVSWTTNVSGNSQVEYGTTVSYGQSTAVNPAMVTNHTVDLSGLTPATQYHFRVKSQDSAGHLATGSDSTFSTTGSGSAPIITNVRATPDSTTAFITWVTDKLADSQVDYGLTASYGQSSALDPTLVSSHSFSLTGLTASTLYHFRVKSRDASGNQGFSGDQTFTTIPLGSGTQVPPNVWVLLPDQVGDASAVTDQGNCHGTPCTRAWFPMVYDSDARKVLVLGGGVGSGCLTVGGGYINDVWEYDFSRNSWKQRLAVDANRTWPPGADNVSAAYDTVQKRTWMQGGTCGLEFGYYDYATNRGTSLAGLAGEHGSGTGVQDPVVAFDKDDNKVLVFAGEPAWHYDPGQKMDQFDPLTNRWADRAPSTLPPGRQQVEYGGVYSTITKKFIAFGGEGDPPVDLDDTWEYDYQTNTWTKWPQANTPNPHPPASSRHVMVYDSNHNVVITVPLFNASTWIYNPVSHTWSVLSGTNAPNGKLMGIAYDSANDVVIVFGGEDGTGTAFQGLRAFRYRP